MPPSLKEPTRKLQKGVRKKKDVMSLLFITPPKQKQQKNFVCFVFVCEVRKAEMLFLIIFITLNSNSNFIFLFLCGSAVHCGIYSK